MVDVLERLSCDIFRTVSFGSCVRHRVRLFSLQSLSETLVNGMKIV